MPDSPAPRPWVGRSLLGGVLMGLANLVPGISGGTMLLAVGIYPDVIESVADVSSLRPHKRALGLLACVVGAALAAILCLAGVVRDLVVDHRWAMYSIFIGLTLGGVPVIRAMIKGFPPRILATASAGLAVMVALAWFQAAGTSEAASSGAGVGLMLMAGLAGAAAMILPGISGGYLLLLMGAYVPLLSGIDDLSLGLRAGDLNACATPLLQVAAPVGLGVVIGVMVVGNAVKWLLSHHEQETLGVLLGLLLGAVVGLYPFQAGHRPEPGDVIKGQVMTAETLPDLSPEDWPTRRFTPTPGQGAAAAGLIILGFLTTLAIARVGAEGPETTEESTS